MLATLGISFLTSHLTEVVVALNKKLQGTFLQGDAAFILSLGMAFVASLVKVFWVDGQPLPTLADWSTWQTIAPTFASIWTVMQVYFLYVLKKLSLDVQPPAPTPVPATVVQPAPAAPSNGSGV